MAKERSLSIKERRLVKNLAEGQPGTVAAVKAGFTGKRAALGITASEKLKDPAVVSALNVLMERMGLTDELLLKKESEALDAHKVSYFAHEGEVVSRRVDVDFAARDRSLDRLWRLKGKLKNQDAANQPQMTANVLVQILAKECEARGLQL